MVDVLGWKQQEHKKDRLNIYDNGNVIEWLLILKLLKSFQKWFEREPTREPYRSSYF